MNNITLPGALHDHFDLGGASYSANNGKLRIVLNADVDVPAHLGQPAADMINTIAKIDDDGVITPEEMKAAGMGLLGIVIATVGKSVQGS